MAYEKRYDMESIAGRNEAVADFEAWVGDKAAETLRNAIRSGEVKSLQSFRFCCELILGVSGPPVTAFAERNGLRE